MRGNGDWISLYWYNVMSICITDFIFFQSLASFFTEMILLKKPWKSPMVLCNGLDIEMNTFKHYIGEQAEITQSGEAPLSASSLLAGILCLMILLHFISWAVIRLNSSSIISTGKAWPEQWGMQAASDVLQEGTCYEIIMLYLGGMKKENKKREAQELL